MADVTMLIEGSYPYISGGVSSWVHSILSHLPEFTFDITHIGAQPDPERQMKYRLPDNIAGFHEYFINETGNIKARRRAPTNPSAWQHFARFHESVTFGRPYDVRTFAQLMAQPGFAGLTAWDIFHSPTSWEMLTSLYQRYAADQSFVDFFWTFRFTYLPLFALLEARMPRAPIYHAVSTGFGGFLGALAKLRNGGKLIVTEHGIYTREREIEIMQAEWIHQSRAQGYRLKDRLGFFQTWWLNLFRFMERLTYDCADAIISITRVNQIYQQQHGANPDKMLLIPNGVNTDRLGQLPRKAADDSEPFTVGFVGRVVSIKDVKTFIRAVKIANEVIPDLKVLIIGPTDEEYRYFQECQRLVEMLELTSVVQFTGPADVNAYYPKLDALALTSLSEGQPLVILEGNGAGVPVVATDVGACRELLEGISDEDQALGPSGLITPVASPEKTAAALIRLWRDPARRRRMGTVGRERVQRYYRQDDLYTAYRSLYRSYLAPAGTEPIPAGKTGGTTSHAAIASKERR